eukprot:CAMPEP_0185030982 /NCGR_PEP_ID=MMETSP1103-20130426/18172_1 /TAXON_ID=36769 /ORGANISM="Paraphysomonas bandaiensis, Strain Caron Lab Isolate" /LENGTH=175 /DNA_ID=CAMNT_0027566311 /DNA_START=150 /DNA_END=674 /DNA_ORIENTATION=+
MLATPIRLNNFDASLLTVKRWSNTPFTQTTGFQYDKHAFTIQTQPLKVAYAASDLYDSGKDFRKLQLQVTYESIEYRAFRELDEYLEALFSDLDYQPILTSHDLKPNTITIRVPVVKKNRKPIPDFTKIGVLGTDKEKITAEIPLCELISKSTKIRMILEVYAWKSCGKCGIVLK